MHTPDNAHTDNGDTGNGRADGGAASAERPVAPVAGTTESSQPSDAIRISSSRPSFWVEPSICRRDGDAIEARLVLDPNQQTFLHDHQLDGQPVLPLTFALELMAETAALAAPEWHVSQVKQLRMLSGIVIQEGRCELIVRAEPSPQQEAPRSWNVRIARADVPGRALYRALVCLTPVLPQPPAAAELAAVRPSAVLSARQAYVTRLFHGPAFQVIERIEGIDDVGVDALVRSEAQRPSLLLHPILLDAAPQLAIVWSRHAFDTTPLPNAVAAYHHFRLPRGQQVEVCLRVSALGSNRNRGRRVVPGRGTCLGHYGGVGRFRERRTQPVGGTDDVSPCDMNHLNTTDAAENEAVPHLRSHGGNNVRTGEDIAIVGMACLFPGADNPADYWHNIVHQVDCITDPPADWQPELFLDESAANPDRVYVGKGGYLGPLCRFSPIKYGIVPNSIEGGEPDQFIALRCAFEALADAGYPELPINRAKTAVIMGRGTYANRGYFSLLQHGFVVDQVIEVIKRLDPTFDAGKCEILRAELKKNLPPSNAETAPGVSHCVLVGRIANRLDLNGPAYTIDAACAASLLAVEQGMRELRDGTCDAVLAGGAQVSTCALVSLIFCQLQALSRTGNISPLSAQANGTLLGSGCGIVVMKRRSDAERDGNRIYCLLKSVGISSDGRAAGILAPASTGQQLAIRNAFERAQLSPATIGLIEAHATGIMLGDSTEIESLDATYGAGGQRPSVALGSVKSQIGHLIPASGSASIIKTALALYHRVLPPTLAHGEANPRLSVEHSRFYVSQEPRPWIHGDEETPRRASVDAFGFGGINAHAILEEHPQQDPAKWESLERVWPVELVVVSAANRQELVQQVTRLADWLTEAEGIRLLDVAATCAKQLLSCRVAICAKDIPDLLKKLRRVAERLDDAQRSKIQDRSGIFWYAEPLAATGRVACVFPGEGAQYPNMLADLCRHFPEVRRQFDLTDRAFVGRPWDERPSRVVFPLPEERAQAETDLFRMEWAADVVAAANRGLLELMQNLGVQFDSAVGHSSGEFIALWAAGAVDFHSEQELVDCIRRGTQCTEEIVVGDLVPAAKLMTVGGIGREPVEEVVAESTGRLQITMDNCPHQVVIAGDEDVTEWAVAKLRSRGAICQPFPWDRAYHTEASAPACRPLEAYIQSIALRPPRIELWSCATASPYPSDLNAVRALAVRQWKSRVRFRETIEAMYAAGTRLFVEVGPRGNLSSFIADTLQGKPHAAVPMNVARTGGVAQLCRCWRCWRHMAWTFISIICINGVDRCSWISPWLRLLPQNPIPSCDWIFRS